MQYLKNSKSIHKKLKELFSTDQRKWAVVAFVGKNPTSLLPKNVKGLHVICWPSAGGTNPDGIRQLIDAGIEVSFCDNMHIKLFYCNRVGVIVGSANLSERALLGGQHEFAVYADDPEFDIRTILSSLGPIVPVNPDSLAKLDIAHIIYSRKNPPTGTPRLGKVPTFQDATASALPKKWKWVTYSDNLSEDEEKELEAELKGEFGSVAWSNYNGVVKDRFAKGEFVLQVKVKKKDGSVAKRRPKWLCVDYVADISSTPVIVELRKSSPSEQPFEIDEKFARAFEIAFNSAKKLDDTDSDGYVSEEFLQAIAAEYDFPPPRIR